MRCLVLLASAGLASACLGGGAAAARVVAVGKCKPSVTSLPTIMAALQAVPSGGTVYVCPGTYAEQVQITKSVALIGASDGTSSAAVIVPPSGGLTITNPDPSGGPPVAALVAAISAGTVTIKNLTVNGSNNMINGCSPDLVGIYFLDSAGSIQNNQVENIILTSGLVGCQSGNAILAENDGTGPSSVAVSVTNNQVENYQKNGVTVLGTGVTTTISGNSITGIGASDQIAQNGIQLGPIATPMGGGAVTGNMVADDVYTGPNYGATGILIYDASGVTVSSNTVTNTQGGVYVYADSTGASDNPTITTNKIIATHTYDAIDVCGVTGGTITGNNAKGSDESAIHIDGECSVASTGATVGGNTANGACAGILVGPNAGYTASNAMNTLINIGTLVLANSDFCPVQMGPASMRPATARTARRALPMH